MFNLSYLKKKSNHEGTFEVWTLKKIFKKKLKMTFFNYLIWVKSQKKKKNAKKKIVVMNKKIFFQIWKEHKEKICC